MATRLPLRAVDPADLNRTWAQGRTYYQYERRAPRALAMEKPAEEMTLDELIATQRSEPLSESRRMFLHLGTGAMSLDAPAAAGATTPLIEFVADTGPKCAFDAIDLDLVEEEADDLTADDKYFTPFTLTDIITRRQIDWERTQAASGPTYRMRLEPTENGRLTVRNHSRYMPRDVNFRDLARSALDSIFSSIGRVATFEELRARIDLLTDILDDPVAAMHRDPDWREERERSNAPDDRIVHSSYEELDEEGNVLVHHRSPRQNPDWETWHHAIRRDSSDPLELAFDLCSDSELESLLGVTEWDDDGNALDSEREELLRATA